MQCGPSSLPRHIEKSTLASGHCSQCYKRKFVLAAQNYLENTENDTVVSRQSLRIFDRCSPQSYLFNSASEFGFDESAFLSVGSSPCGCPVNLQLSLELAVRHNSKLPSQDEKQPGHPRKSTAGRVLHWSVARVTLSSNPYQWPCLY